MDETMIRKKLEGDYSRKDIDAEGQVLILGMELTDQARLVGDLMIRLHSEVHRMGEIGWVISPEFSGQGLASEGARELLRLGFEVLGLHRVIARVEAQNAPSRRLAERIGMRQEAELLLNEWFKGGWSSEVDFAMLESEWREIRDSP